MALEQAVWGEPACWETLHHKRLEFPLDQRAADVGA